MTSPALTGPGTLALFAILKDGAAAVFVNTQVMIAPARFAVAGIVTDPALAVATGFVLPEFVALASLQETPLASQARLDVSVMVASALSVATSAVGAAGWAVPATVVEIIGKLPVIFVSAKSNGPPKPPVVTFWTATVGNRVLVMVQDAVWARLKVRLEPESVPAVQDQAPAV